MVALNLRRENWSSLYQNPDGGAIPALVDQNTLMWALKMGMGGRLNYVDGEGKPFEVEVVGAFKGSMLQGALFIKEDDFLDKFKQQGGYRSFMLTGNKEDAKKLAVHLEDRLFQHGMEFRDSLEKLAELQKVENTYLSIFQGSGRSWNVNWYMRIRVGCGSEFSGAWSRICPI